jgi:predicted N-formylglutamate amidohydrolase
VSAVAFVVTCEHGGNRVPAPWARLFRGQQAALRSHRGFDPGALLLARELARALRAPLVAATTTRLLVDLNRAEHNRAVFSAVTRGLPAATRAALLARYHRPHRARVAKRIAERIARGRRVVHVAAHSFTPALDGRRRDFEVGLLYDPRRPAERALCLAWQAALRRLEPGVRVRRNQPYRGIADGLTTHLRRAHGGAVYCGIELEVNQAVVAGPPARWRRLRAVLLEGLRAAARR